MSLNNHDLMMLENYLPPNTALDVIDYMHSYKIHLKIKRERKSILGDYRPAHLGKPHTISLNANLNEYHFLITFLHELAHLINHLNHGRKVSPHGKEWKDVFSLLLNKFTSTNIFPNDVKNALIKSMQSLSASTCSDPVLFKILRRYDKPHAKILVDELEIGDIFTTDQNRRFKVIAKRRTRYECEEMGSRKRFLFPGIYEVFKE
jgi:SprT protein